MLLFIINASRFQQRNSTTDLRRKYIKLVKTMLFFLLSSKFNFSLRLFKTPAEESFSLLNEANRAPSARIDSIYCICLFY